MNARKKPPDQAQKFKDAARKSGADENEANWAKRLGKLVKAKPKKE